MAYPEGEQRVVDLAHALRGKVVDSLSAVCGYNFELVRHRFHDFGDIVAAFLREVAEYSHLVVEALPRHVAAESFVHSAIETDSDKCASGVFYWLHDLATALAVGARETSAG
jgi:hypothetical protein